MYGHAISLATTTLNWVLVYATISYDKILHASISGSLMYAIHAFQAYPLPCNENIHKSENCVKLSCSWWSHSELTSTTSYGFYIKKHRRLYILFSVFVATKVNKWRPADFFPKVVLFLWLYIKLLFFFCGLNYVACEIRSCYTKIVMVKER